MRASVVSSRIIMRSGCRMYGAPVLSNCPACAVAAIAIARSSVAMTYVIFTTGSGD